MMLEPQKSELPHETEYFLDGAVECLDMDHGTRMVLIVFGDRRRIEGILEERERGNFDPHASLPEAHARHTRNKARLLAKCDQLTAYVNELLAQLDPVYQIGSHLTAINGLLAALHSHANHYADWAISDSIEGGCMASFNDRKFSWREHEKRDIAPTKRISRRLHSPAFIKRYIETREESLRMRRLWHTLARRGVPDYSNNQLDAALTVFDAAYDQHLVRVKAAQDRAMAAFVAGIDARKGAKKPPYRIVKQKRKVTKRAAIFAAGLLGASTVSAFASGQPVHIEGQDMVFEVKKRGTVFRDGHGALELAVLDKDRAKLCDLCFYIEGTPALDQLTGIALAVRAGEERDILSTANITRVAQAGVGHGFLGERAFHVERERIPTAVMINGVIRPFHDRQAVRRIRNETYWQETKDIWVNTLGVYVFNRQWKNVKGMLKA